MGADRTGGGRPPVRRGRDAVIVGRRIFLKATAVAGAGTAVAGVGGWRPPEASAEEQADVVVRVDSDAASSWTVSRSIFGKFHEHNGRDAYPGIYDQHLANGSFEEWAPSQRPTRRTEVLYPDTRNYDGIAYPWEPVPREDPRGRYLLLDGGVGNGRRNGPKYQRVGVSGTAAGIGQRLALPDHRTLHYDLSVSLRGGGGVAGVEARLEEPDGTVLARQTVPVSGSWQRRRVRLRLNRASRYRYQDPRGVDSPFGELVLVFLIHGDGHLDLDWAMLLAGDAVRGKFNPTTIELLREFDVTSLRWPGGNFASQYRWRDGVGPLRDRPVVPIVNWGGLEPNHLGTDEFLEFCEIAGVEPYLNVAFSEDVTPEEAARWVEYVNGDVTTPMGRLRAAHGRTEPWGVKAWQVGNETYGPYQVGHTDAGEFARRFRAYDTAMKRADPTITVIAAGIDPLYTDYGDPFGTPPEWNRTLFEIAGDAHVDGVDIHRYARGIVVPRARRRWLADNDTDPVGYNQVLVAFPTEFEALLEELRADAAERGIDDLFVTVGEWNLQPNINGTPGWPRAGYRTMAHAAFVAGMLNVFIRQGDAVRWAHQRDNTLYHRPYPVDLRPVNPGNHTWRIYAEPLLRGDAEWQSLRVRVLGPTLTIPRTGIRIREMRDVPYVDAAAVRSRRGGGAGDRVHIYATNRDLRRSHTVEFSVGDWPPGVVRGDRGGPKVPVVLQTSVPATAPFAEQTSYDGPNSFQVTRLRREVDPDGKVRLRMPPASVARLDFGA